MITNNQKQTALTSSTKLINAIIEFKALVAENGLPITDNIDTLETALRSQLFQKLLSVDKGLKMRFDLLKTDEARVKLITETINLDGYEQVTELRTALKEIEIQYQKVWTGHTFLHKIIPFPLFCEKWEMNLDAVLQSMVFDWAGKEDALEYFQNLAPALTKMREVFRAITHSAYGLHETLMLLASYYTSESDKGTIEADEAHVMGFANHLERSKALHLLKK